MNPLEKRLLALVFCVGILCASPRSWAQAADADLPDTQVSPAQTDPKPPEDRVVTWRSLPGDFLHDQKDIWLFPVQLAKGHHWVPTLAVAGITTGLVFADPHVMPFFRDHAQRLDRVNDAFDPTITTAEVVAIPAVLMMGGYRPHD